MAKLAMVHEKLDRGDATKDYGVDLPYPQLMNINGSTKTLAMVSMMFMETTLELKLKAGMNQLAHQLLVSSQCTQVRGKLRAKKSNHPKSCIKFKQQSRRKQ